MDWMKELLKKAGFDETKIDSLLGDVNKELPKHFVPKTQYNELSEAKKKAEKDVAERDAQITELGKTAGLSEDLKKQIETLTAANTAAAEKHEAELKELQLSNAIKSALSGKVHDETIAAGLVDRTKLVLDGEKVVGLDEQVTALKASHAFIFKPDAPAPGTPPKPPGFHVGGGGNPTPPSGEVSLKDALTAHFQTKQ